MSLIRGFRRIHLRGSVGLWSLEDAQQPLSVVLDLPVVGLDRSPEVVLSPADGVRGYQRHDITLRVARHQLRGGELVEGILNGRTASEVADVAFDLLEPAPGTELGRWLQASGLGDRAQVELGAWLEDTRGDVMQRRRLRMGRRGPRRGFGLVPPDFEVDLQPIELGDDDWLFALDDGGERAIVAEHRPRFGEHSVRQKLWAVQGGVASGLRWFDGRQVGFADGVEQLPAALRERLERRGRSERAPELRAALNDLEPLFLLRKPTTQECRGVRPAEVAPPIDTPAILISTMEPVRLLGLDERPIDVPIIADPAQALSILGRSFSDRIYVPHAPCVGRRHVRLPDRPTWVVGVLPRCLCDR